MSRAFVSCDWGTTHFRLRWVERDAVRAEVRTGEGVASLAAADDRAGAFRQVLARGRQELGAPGGLPVVISGMAGSSIGWKELPYAGLPFPLDGSGAIWEEIEPRVFLVSGVRGETEVMRGEETEVLGAAAGATLPAVFVLPGTHSKHVEVSREAITKLRTFMTGEFFEVLGRHSVLRHSIENAGLTAEAFAQGVRESRQGPLTATAFRVRTRQLLDRQPAEENACYLSGLLIGAELGTLIGEDRPLFFCATERLLERYAAAARELGLHPVVLSSGTHAVRGQAIILERILSEK